jgi:hypothetical protein
MIFKEIEFGKFTSSVIQFDDRRAVCAGALPHFDAYP